MKKQIDTSSKKARGRARRSLDLIEAMYAAAEKAHPITGRGIGYKLFLKGYAAVRGYQRGWVAHKFREKWKHWPNGLEHLPPISPSPSTASWIKSRNIAWAKARSA
jgi:hypothetical protein